MLRITKSVAEKRLSNISPEEQFWCHDGRYLKNLQELEAALEQMAEETFRYHVNETKGDFSNWVRDVIQDTELAQELASTMEKDEATTYIVARLDYYG